MAKWTRRDVLKLGSLTAAGVMAPASLTACATSTAPPRHPAKTQPAKLRNVIFLVSDGMSAGIVSLADSFSRIARGPEHGTHWASMMQTPGVVQGLTETYSLNSIVTDSAAAASAWGSGSRVNNGAINILPDGRHLTPMAKLLKDTGRRVGLVTTCTITHATPAGFAVNVEKRGDEQAIAQQYLGLVDVLLGGGRNHFMASTRKDKHDLAADFAAQGYTLCSDRDQLVASGTSSRLLGLFDKGHLPYTVDQNQSDELKKQVPTLAQMTRAAIASLDQGDKGFFLMVEGGRVDHAAHANDAAAALWDQLAFDDALGAALTYAAGRDDTLVVVTTDHGNSNPGLNGGGNLSQVATFRASYGSIFRRIKELADPADAPTIIQAIDELADIRIKPEHAEALAKVARKESIGELGSQHRNVVGALGQILGHHTGIGWTGVTHTADYATLSALGPFADHFAGLGRNVDTFGHITRAMGIDHVNPSLPPAENWRVARGGTALEAHTLLWTHMPLV